jgi:NAD(P)-dependent dehydrogenase (short-subunit alcohol dehydrogenase family)
MGRVEGKVAFITGAARGQGRSHAMARAEEGADIIAVDIGEDYQTVGYPSATAEELQETVSAVEALDRRIVASQVDVRDADAIRTAVEHGVAEPGRLDIVCADAGSCTTRSWDEVTPPRDSSTAVPFLASAASRYVTGLELKVDARSRSRARARSRRWTRCASSPR